MRHARQAVIVAARRTLVAPRGGALAQFQADELAAPVFQALLKEAGVNADRIEQVVMGNALYGGGNPARLAALRAGLPVSTPAMTVDTQCCSGLDAILHAARLIESGSVDCVIAGGMESFSRSPIRAHRPRTSDEDLIPYNRPPFAPPPFNDPELAEAAFQLARKRGYTRSLQAAYSVESHKKAQTRSAKDIMARELVSLPGINLASDPFTRSLSLKTALRARVIAGDEEYGVCPATTAVEADAAAAVLILERHRAQALGFQNALTIEDGCTLGHDPGLTPEVPIKAVAALCSRHPDVDPQTANIELMEAYSSQAMAFVDALALDPANVNVCGGALSRGHPIGASGAILVVRLFSLLSDRFAQTANLHAAGIATIAAAGGLATAALFKACRL
ncbi:putative acetyl-CoA C-acetyltransferase VraB [Roseibium sp. TrichSKD4]|uniref:thiolase family protein n=1 Tax=Roseibium sp. TrichSKD4 TaxID=744980 RepID=UPI0001E56DE0|nr:thiolase family protein [Roseibium sp. TrichSKD4]EFO32149.1 putative acetyl-CoA C-acetyltransferase VraB [Roseibium sp. TrichSKD4]